MKLAGKPYEAHLLAVIVLYILGFAVYLNSFPVPFVFDDFPNIRDNPSVRLASMDLEEIRAAAFESHASRRPVANVSFALNYVVGGYDVKGYHLVNILIHIANGVLVYFLVFVLLRCQQGHARPVSMPASNARLAALVAAAVFVAHPVQSQAVTYIVQRMTSMATMFYLLALLLYLLGRLRADPARRYLYWLAALASWLLALGSKEIAATLPLVIVVAEYLFFRDADKTWPGIHPAILLFALIASAAVVVLYLGTDPGTAIAAQYAGRDLTPTERMLTELRVIVFYSSLLLFPYPGRLNLDHAFSVSHSLMDPMSTLAATFVLLALACTGLALIRRQPILSFSILWFLITLSIESSFIGLDLVFEHRLYLPMFGVALALGYLFSMVARRRLALATTLAGLIVVVLAAGTIVRNETWQDPAALWADAAAKNPSSYRAHNNLGRVLVARGQAEQAALQFSEAIRLKPDYAEAYNNLGTVHAQTGRLELARVNFTQAIELNPRYAQAYNNLGVALLGDGRSLEAARQLAVAIRLEPRYAKAHANLSDALARMGQVAAACRHLLTAIELDPAVPRPKATALTCHADTNSN